MQTVYNPVSYTHLDVYKRQLQIRATHRRTRETEPPDCGTFKGNGGKMVAKISEMCIRDRVRGVPKIPSKAGNADGCFS